MLLLATSAIAGGTAVGVMVAVGLAVAVAVAAAQCWLATVGEDALPGEDGDDHE